MSVADVDAVLMQLQDAARRARLQDFFAMFDKHHLKRVTPTQGVRALEMAGCHLSPKDVHVLTHMYTDADSGMFNYEALILDANDTKPSGFFEKHPEIAPSGLTRTTGGASSLSGSLGATNQLAAGDAERLDQLRSDLRHQVSVRGILLKRVMRDYDDHARGTVTRTRFVRAFSSLFPRVPVADIELIANAYASVDGLDVRYMALHNDITPAEDDFNTGVRGVMGTSTSLGGALTNGAPPPHPRAISPEKVCEYMAIPADDLAAVEASLIRQVFERRIRVIDYFLDFDKLRRGHVTRSQFHRGIASFKLLGVSPAAIDALATKYAVSSDASGDTISYVAFSDAVEQAFTEKGLEKDPTKELDSFARTVVTAPHPRFVRPELPAEERSALDKALNDMTQAIRKWRRYNVKAMLADYDKTCEGMVTETQFLRVLAMFDLVPHDATERRVLLDYFRGRGVKSHMIDYRAFLGDVFEVGMA